jgi:hypothetical protein
MYGYLYHGYTRTMYECVDIAMEIIPGSQADTNGGLLSMLRLTAMRWPVLHTLQKKSLPCHAC